MERQLWNTIVQVVHSIDKRPFNPRCRFQAEVIVMVWMWGVIHDRPMSWTCERCNWPPWSRLPLPSAATMSRRLRSPEVMDLLERMEEHICRVGTAGNLVWMIDGKPLVISGCSQDRQAGYGRATGGKAKGYKLHVIVGENGTLAAWRVAPMNLDERRMARRMLKSACICGYVIGDANYDSNALHRLCDEHGNLQFIAPRRYGTGRGFGHRKQTPGRLRCVAILESPFAEFGKGLLTQRLAIERYFSQLTTHGCGLTHLPPWIRTHRRVRRWVQAKLIINSLRNMSS